jgi:DMSO/TMAO reductase YedYZ heme-binding membrane subunit
VSVTAALVIASALVPEGLTVEGWGAAARRTARLSFLLFLAAYLARPWAALAPGALSRGCLRHRRSLGLGFATAHGFHFAMLTAVGLAKQEWPSLQTLILGGFGYVVVVAMAATSNDAAVRALGGRRWKQLHRFGVHYLWLIFMLSYLTRTLSNPGFYAPLLLLALVAAGIRALAWRAARTLRVAPAGSPA